MRSVLPAAAAVLAAACATTSVTPPPAGTLDLPRLSYPALRGHTVKLAVLDHRAERAQGAELVRVTEADVARSLARAGVVLDGTGDAVLDLRILQYRADFHPDETSAWEACVRLSATVEVAAGPWRQLPVDRCVKKEVMGLHTGDRALEQAYAEAMTELLSRLDQLR